MKQLSMQLKKEYERSIKISIFGKELWLLSYDSPLVSSFKSLYYMNLLTNFLYSYTVVTVDKKYRTHPVHIGNLRFMP